MIFHRDKKSDSVPDYAVEAIEVKRTYNTGDKAVQVLRGLDLQVKPGALIALYGPSGSGKTTLLNLVGTLDQPTAGTIRIYGQDIVRMSEGARAELRRSQIGFIFQSYALIPTYSALENIDIVLRLPHLNAGKRRKRAMSALDTVGLSAWADHVPEELSGGQQQRVAIARALALHPKLILADEPTAGLDTRMARRMLMIFKAIASLQNTTFLIVSHDPLVAEHVDIAYDLLEGKLVPHVNHTIADYAPQVGSQSPQKPQPAAAVQ